MNASLPENAEFNFLTFLNNPVGASWATGALLVTLVDGSSNLNKR